MRHHQRATIAQALWCLNLNSIHLGETICVRRLHHLSVALFIGGILLTIVGVVGSLDPLWTLSGLLLAIAGGVKLLVVHLWQNVIQIEDNEGMVHRG